MEMHRSFPPNSWEDLHLVYGPSPYPVFPIQHYQRFFCPPGTSSPSIFTIYPRLVTFHPRRWLRVWPRRPGSKSSTLNSNRRLPALIEYARLPLHGPSFLLSPPSDSGLLASI